MGSLSIMVIDESNTWLNRAIAKIKFKLYPHKLFYLVFQLLPSPYPNEYVVTLYVNSLFSSYLSSIYSAIKTINNTIIVYSYLRQSRVWKIVEK